MKWVPDATGRFERRPHYAPAELDAECEAVVARFLREKHERASYPVATDDLLVLLESLTADLDVYADLSGEGPNVEGVTYFDPDGGKPSVRIDAGLSEDPRREHRWRTTLAHELGHVVLHALLWKLEPSAITKARLAAASPRCRRESLLRARPADWMEWQAAFASGAFLMPQRALAAATEEIQAAVAWPVVDSSSVANDLVRHVQGRFQVSADAARVRLTQAGYLTRGTWVYSVSKQPRWYRQGSRRMIR